VRIEIVYHPVRLNQRRIHYGADREEIEDQMLKEIEDKFPLAFTDGSFSFYPLSTPLDTPPKVSVIRKNGLLAHKLAKKIEATLA